MENDLKANQSPISDKANPRRRSRFGRWLFAAGRLDRDEPKTEKHPWYLVIWLTGVDYFSTLGYQPGIALIAAGALSPLATAVLVAVTLLGALPVYAQVASRSYVGQGSIAMLENLLSGWTGKIFVLVLLGFAGTDFVITMTLSASDAARHAVENPYLSPLVGHAHVALTLGLLALLALVFLMGFREAIGFAFAATVPYLLLNVVVLLRGGVEIARHPDLIAHWRLDLAARGDWTMLLIASGILFPKLALGLSGFETGVSVMPLIAGNGETDGTDAKTLPVGRIRATRKLLSSAAVIMAVLLIGSSFVTTLLIPPDAYKAGGPASGRAIAYLAHQLLGSAFGSVYDLASIVILWFAGASAMAGLLNLIPRYLPRYGMAPRWVAFHRPLVLTLFAIDVVVTVVFDASVDAQGGAYATGVLALILSASVAVALALWRESTEPEQRTARTRALSLYFWFISVVFLYTFIDNIIERTDGIIIASIFILLVVAISAVSRYRRATELRVADVKFVGEDSERLWKSMIGRKVNLVPVRTGTEASRRRKATDIRQYHKISGPLAFVTVHLMDNRSEFKAPLRIRVTKEGDDYAVEAYGAIAIANTLAFISEMIDPIGIYIQLTGRNLMIQALRFLLWGEGEVGLSLYSILVRYWEWTPVLDVRPLIVLTCDRTEFDTNRPRLKAERLTLRKKT